MLALRISHCVVRAGIRERAFEAAGVRFARVASYHYSGSQCTEHAARAEQNTIFNVGGNKFRIITFIDFESGRVYVRYVLTHKEYDQGDWKNDAIEGKGATQSEVSKECKIAESTISEVLSGRRRLNRKQVERLSGYFCVEPTVFLSSK